MPPLLYAFLAACPRGGVVDPTGPTGATGDTGTPPTTTSTVTSPDQTQACIDYLACLEAAEAPTLADAQAEYGADSDCWTDLESARSCNEDCIEDLQDQALETPTVTECWTQGVPQTNALFSAAGITGAQWTVLDAEGDAQCLALPGRAATLVGSADADFAFTLLDASAYPPQSSTGQCTLSVDRGFSCPVTDPYFGEWTGAIRPAFDALDFTLAFAAGDVVFTCEVEVGPAP